MAPDHKKHHSKKKSHHTTYPTYLTRKSEHKHKKIKGFRGIIYNNLPKICYVIAISDLLHALYFTVEAMILLIESFSIISMLAVLGVVFWFVIVIVLLVGLWKRKPPLIKCWLLFSIAGFFVDILFLLWGIGTSIKVDWDRLQEFTIVFLGIFFESICIYIVFWYYTTIEKQHKKPKCCKMFHEKKKKKHKTEHKKSRKGKK